MRGGWQDRQIPFQVPHPVISPPVGGRANIAANGYGPDGCWPAVLPHTLLREACKANFSNAPFGTTGVVVGQYPTLKHAKALGYCHIFLREKVWQALCRCSHEQNSSGIARARMH